MAYTTIDDPSAHFHTQLFTGTGSELSVTNDANAGDFSPDLIWIKNRAISASHVLTDTTRGVTKSLFSDQSSAEATEAQQLKSFNTDGFTVGTSNNVNGSSNGSVAWQWKANGGTTTSVSGTGTTAGSTKAGTYQANTTAGFSIVSFSTGTEDDGDHRIEHGLGVVPNFIITKDRNGSAYTWYLYHHKGTDDNDYLRFDTNPVVATGTGRNVFDGSDFTSTYFEMDHNNILPDNTNLIAYCFAEKQGYSKFGSYTGNGSADGPFVYTGFKPAWIMVKRTSASGENWNIRDNKRSPINPANENLLANNNRAEENYYATDLVSNGFKIRTSEAGHNTSGATYVYMAFAESPFVSSEGVPTTAR
jgi:hypothetical protein